MKRAAIALVFLVAGCCNPKPPDPNPPQPTPPKPVPTVVVDSGPAPTPPAPSDAFSAACAHLASLGCPEAAAANCGDRMRAADQQHLTTVPVACLTAANTKAAARACGFVKCP